jgi:hypothetical protein
MKWRKAFNKKIEQKKSAEPKIRQWWFLRHQAFVNRQYLYYSSNSTLHQKSPQVENTVPKQLELHQESPKVAKAVPKMLECPKAEISDAYRTY